MPPKNRAKSLLGQNKLKPLSSSRAKDLRVKSYHSGRDNKQKSGILAAVQRKNKSLREQEKTKKERTQRNAGDKAYSGPGVTVIRGPKEVDSSWVDRIAYIRYGRKNGVAIQFLDGAQCFYPSTTVKDYEYLRDARSKGKSVWKRFYELYYDLIN